MSKNKQANTMTLMVDYEDQVDWLQDNVIIHDVVCGVSHQEMMETLSKRVVEETRYMYQVPSAHLKVMGWAPAYSGDVVKKGFNFWTDPENIWSDV